MKKKERRKIWLAMYADYADGDSKPHVLKACATAAEATAAVLADMERWSRNRRPGEAVEVFTDAMSAYYERDSLGGREWRVEDVEIPEPPAEESARAKTRPGRAHNKGAGRKQP